MEELRDVYPELALARVRAQLAERERLSELRRRRRERRRAWLRRVAGRGDG